MPKPSLLLVLTEFPPSYGGMQTHAVEMAAQLHATGSEILVLTYRCADTELASAEAFDRAQPYPIRRCLSRLVYWSNVALIAKAAREHNADVIYSSTVYYGQAAARAKVPMVCRSAGNDVLRPWIAWPFRFAAGLLNFRLFERSLYPWLRKHEWPELLDALLLQTRTRVMRESALAMRHISANSEFSRRALLKLGVAREKVDCVPGGVDAKRFSPGPMTREELDWPREAFVLFTACRLVEKKGLPLLLDAMASLGTPHRDLHLCVAGDGPERARLEARASALGIASRVHWCGRLEARQLALAYRSANLFVFPSHTVRRSNGWIDAETMGRVLCEANASGLPVLAAASGGIPSVIRNGKNGVLFREADAGALAKAIEAMMADAQLRDRLAAEGRKRALRDFDWPRIVARQRSVIARVLLDNGSSIITEKAGVVKPQAWEVD
jgi:phosphatidyl-myo-inositol dimannoside synthase